METYIQRMAICPNTGEYIGSDLSNQILKNNYLSGIYIYQKTKNVQYSLSTFI